MRKVDKILITTPSLPPEFGGLATFTHTIITTLETIGTGFDLFHWKNVRELQQYQTKSEYTLVINIHFLAGHFLKNVLPHARMINFIHGSEILFHSPNPIKYLYKKMFRRKILKTFADAYLNIFISEFTLLKLSSHGHQIDHSRDIIFHNCSEMENAKLFNFPLAGPVRFSCVARDVPHKNIDGTILFCEQFSRYFNLPVELSISRNALSQSIKIISIAGIRDQEREKLFQNSHFNLLFSLDHSRRGFFEGFGLTCLEAGKYGTPSIVYPSGGLPENVHHGLNGFVFNPFSPSSMEDFVGIFQEENYQKMRERTYAHTLHSHSSKNYISLFKGILL